jgi:hypothetical protein
VVTNVLRESAVSIFILEVKMETEDFSEWLVATYMTIQCHIPEDCNLMVVGGVYQSSQASIIMAISAFWDVIQFGRFLLMIPGFK